MQSRCRRRLPCESIRVDLLEILKILVRFPSGDPSTVRKVLDTGVNKILIPRVESPDEVRRAIEASRFVYEGRPGRYGATAGRDSGWGDVSSVDVAAHDETVSVRCTIETQTAG